MERFENYRSPYSWRYGSSEMRGIWSEVNKRRWWRRLWVALAEVQESYGLVSAAQVKELRSHVEDVDVGRSLSLEEEIRHDLLAELKIYAEQCPSAAGILHLGATSTDVKDNAAVLMTREALSLTLQRLRALLLTLVEQIRRYADTPTLGYTHLQPAEPTTLGYRFASYAQDLWLDFRELSRMREQIKGKGFRGAVGTSASYRSLLAAGELDPFQERLSQKLDLAFHPVVNQTYPRRQEYHLVSALASVAAAINRMAFDLRILQSPPFGEWSEPFGEDQVGSSAMPFKKNPIQAEKLNSIARLLAQFPRAAWDNAAFSLLERTLDDSANRRTILPESFLIADELLLVTDEILSDLAVYHRGIAHNLDAYGAFAATEPLLMALSKQGAGRQDMHERLRQHSLRAWSAVQEGKENPLLEYVLGDDDIRRYLSAEEIKGAMDIRGYVGDAPRRAARLASRIEGDLKETR